LITCGLVELWKIKENFNESNTHPPLKKTHQTNTNSQIQINYPETRLISLQQKFHKTKIKTCEEIETD
jgi:hypothetical protein